MESLRAGIREAKNNLSRLILAAQAGEEVIITRGGKPVARLVHFSEEGGRRPLGLFKAKVIIRGDLLDPLPEEVVADFWPRGANTTDDLSS